MSTNIKQAKKLLLLDNQPSLAIFDELQELNTLLQGVIQSVNSSKPTDITINNPEDIRTELEIPEVNFEPITTSLQQVLSSIKEIKSPDFKGIETLLNKIATKDIDVSELNNVSDILGNILFAIQNIAETPNEKGEELIPDLKAIQSILNILNDNVVSLEVPEFDYDKLAKIIKKNLNITVGGGGGISKHSLNVAGTVINPSTEEKQDDIITAVNNVSGLQRSTDMEGGGKTSVGTTAVEITFSGTTESIIITSDKDNTGVLFVGKSDVTNLGANAFTQLQAGQSLTLEFDDTTNSLYVVSDTASQNFWAGALK